MSTTALERIAEAFDLLNVFEPALPVGSNIPAADQAKAFRMLNNMIKGWNLDAFMSPVGSREVFPLIAGRGFPVPYTIGPGGDFNTSRPPTASSITGAALLLGTTGVEIWRGSLLNDAQYNQIAIKNLPNSIPTWVHYDATYMGGFGSIQVWGVPNDATNSLVLYREQPFAAFTSLTANYDLPDGMEETIDYNLARRLKTPYGRAMDADALQLAEAFLSRWKVSNVEIDDLPVDPMWIGSNPRGGFNIQTGE